MMTITATSTTFAPQSFESAHRAYVSTQVDWTAVPEDIHRAFVAWRVTGQSQIVDEAIPLESPVAAVEFIAQQLQISQDRVLKAAGIAERTFYGWKTEARRPRVSSLGSLWALVQVVERLSDGGRAVSRLFQGSARAQQAFDRGDANGIVQALLLDASNGSAPNWGPSYDLRASELGSATRSLRRNTPVTAAVRVNLARRPANRDDAE